MTLAEKKEYLESYMPIVKAVKRIQEEIEQLRIDKMFPSIEINDMPHGTEQKDLSDYIVKLNDLEQKLINTQKIKIELYTRILEEIENLDNETEREVLTYRYIRGYSWEQICEEIGYSYKQTHRIHINALQHFEKMT